MLALDLQRSFLARSAERWSKSLQHPTLVVFGLFVCVLIAYAGQQEYLARDDVFFKNDHWGSLSLAVASYGNGRFLPGFFFHSLSLVGVRIHEIWHFLEPIAYITFAIFGYVFVNNLKHRTAQIDKFLCASIAILFPFSINFLINKNNLINFIFAFGSISIAIFLFRRFYSWKIVPFCSLLLLFSASSYQTSIYYFVIFVCGFGLFNGHSWLELKRILFRGAAAVFVGLGAYLLVYSLISGPLLQAFGTLVDEELIQHYVSGRSKPNNFNGFLDSSLIYLFSILRTLIAPEPVLSGYAKLFALAVFSLSFLSWSHANRAMRERSASYRWDYNRISFLILLLILLLGSPIHLFIEDDFIAPRILAHASGVWAVLFLLAISVNEGRLRQVVRVCAAVFALWLGASTETLVNGARALYEQDILLGKRIVNDLTSTPGFDIAKPVTVIGRIHRNSPYPLINTRRYYDIQASNFVSDWSKKAILEEASGHKFVHATPSFIVESEELCRQHLPLDGYYATIVTNNGSMVCLVDLEDRSEIIDP